MSVVRPEAVARLRMLREPILSAGVLTAGLWLIWRGYVEVGPLALAIGTLMALAGAGLLRASLRRLRLSAAEMGEGVVVIDEARIGYMGPHDGGFVDLPSLVSVEIVAERSGVHAWILTSEDGTRLSIPLGAKGADGIFDALSPLPGIDFDAGAAALGPSGPRRIRVWGRSPPTDVRRLH
jgi:hypothetical protein